MTYLRYTPSPPLDHYIDHLYYLDGSMPFPRERILPYPAADLKINLGGTFAIYDNDHTGRPKRLTESWLTGISSVYHSIDWPQEMRLYGVRFKPSGAYPLLGIPMSEFYNQVVSLEAFWGRFASEIRGRLAAAPSIQAGLVLFEQQLLARLRVKPGEQNLVDYCIAELNRQHGDLSIRSLSNDVGISQNHLATQFKRVVGTSAKEMARLYRFEYVLRSIDPTQPVHWTQIALKCGYYDQSHFSKEFVAFTGYSPSNYQLLRHQVYTMNAPIDQFSPRMLPID